MSVIRVHKNKNFTVMSNIHLRDKNLSLKAKGLLSVMLSLPDSWDYSIAGLCAICKENETAVKSAINELKANRYVIVKREEPTKENGGRIKYNYEVYEEPQPIQKQDTEKQGVENLGVEFQGVEFSTQLNTNKSNTNELNTNGLSTDTEKEKTLTNVNAKVKTSLSERKQMPKSAKQKYLDKKADELDMLNRILQICNSRYDSSAAEELYDSLKHYFEKYTEKTGKIHPILTDNVLIDIIDRMANFSDTEYEHFENVIGQHGVFIKIIDSYFSGDYGSLKGYETNWHLPHFMSDGVLNRLTQRLWEIGEVY